MLKEYISCEWIEHGIACMYDGIYNCCFFPNKVPSPISKTKNNKYNFEEFFEIKNKIRVLQKEGQILESCINCPNLEKKNWDNENKIKFMIISSYTKCSSNCIYCYTHSDKENFNNKPDIPVLNFIKDCIKKKTIDKNTFVIIGGGEPTESKEFDSILDLLQKIAGIRIKIYSSGIKYSKKIENCLKSMNIELVISTDSGDKNLYRQIKGVDAFERVWLNLKKYSLASNKLSKVIVKYIFIKDVNDNIYSINKFLEKVVESDIKYIKAELEYNSLYLKYINNKEEMNKIFKLIKHLEESTHKLGINYLIGGNLYCAEEKYNNLNNNN